MEWNLPLPENWKRGIRDPTRTEEASSAGPESAVERPEDDRSKLPGLRRLDAADTRAA